MSSANGFSDLTSLETMCNNQETFLNMCHYITDDFEARDYDANGICDDYPEICDYMNTIIPMGGNYFCNPDFMTRVCNDKRRDQIKDSFFSIL